MCADCGNLDRHSPGCSQFDFSWNSQTADAGEENPSTSRAICAPADPLTLLLQRPVGDPDTLRDNVGIVDWMIVQLARQIADVPDREARLRAVWTQWLAKLTPEYRPLLDYANEHVRYALDQRRAS